MPVITINRRSPIIAIALCLASSFVVGCSGEPSTSDKKKAARVYLETNEAILAGAADIDDIKIDTTLVVDDQTRKVYFTATYMPKVDLDGWIKMAVDEITANPDLMASDPQYQMMGHKKYLSFLQSPFARSANVNLYGDFKTGVPFTKSYWIHITKADNGWVYLTF